MKVSGSCVVVTGLSFLLGITLRQSVINWCPENGNGLNIHKEKTVSSNGRIMVLWSALCDCYTSTYQCVLPVMSHALCSSSSPARGSTFLSLFLHGTISRQGMLMSWNFMRPGWYGGSVPVYQVLYVSKAHGIKLLGLLEKTLSYYNPILLSAI